MAHNLMRAAARAFSVVALAVARDLHQRGFPIDREVQSELLAAAERAMFEHEVVTGAPLLAVRGAHGWCAVIDVDGIHCSACDRWPSSGRPQKDHRITCPRCRAAFGAPLVVVLPGLPSVMGGRDRT